MKKVIYLALSIVVIFSALGFNTIEAAVSEPKFKINNSNFVTPKDEPAPYINKDGRTMGSLRLVANAVGVSNADIKWDATTTTATLTKGERTVSVTLGKNEMNVNGSVVKMDTKAEMKQGRVFIPARFIAEGLGMYVGFNSIQNIVLISDTPINEQVTNNIEEVLEMEVSTTFPVKFNTEGINLTVHDMYLYDVNSDEGKAIEAEHNLSKMSILHLIDYKKAYIVQMKVTIKNEGNNVLEYGYNNPRHFIGLVTGTAGGRGKTITPSYTFNKNNNGYDNWNNPILLDYLELEAGESITGYYYFVLEDSIGMDFIDIKVGRNNTVKKIIAEK